MNSPHRGSPTAESLRRIHRRQERRLQSREAILREMRDHGAALHLQHSPSGDRWHLSTGQAVHDTTARDIIGDRHIVGVGDALLPGVPCQTYRYTEEELT